MAMPFEAAAMREAVAPLAARLAKEISGDKVREIIARAGVVIPRPTAEERRIRDALSDFWIT